MWFYVLVHGIPFAIFTGQIVAALTAGNTLVAKPSGQTFYYSKFCCKINKYAVSDERVTGVTFTSHFYAAHSIHIIEVKSINDIPDEKFGPILRITKFKSKNLDKVIDEINNFGFGLTFGFHSRIEEKIEHIRSRAYVGEKFFYTKIDQLLEQKLSRNHLVEKINRGQSLKLVV